MLGPVSLSKVRTLQLGLGRLQVQHHYCCKTVVSPSVVFGGPLPTNPLSRPGRVCTKSATVVPLSGGAVDGCRRPAMPCRDRPSVAACWRCRWASPCVAMAHLSRTFLVPRMMLLSAHHREGCEACTVVGLSKDDLVISGVGAVGRDGREDQSRTSVYGAL